MYTDTEESFILKNLSPARRVQFTYSQIVMILKGRKQRYYKKAIFVIMDSVEIKVQLAPFAVRLLRKDGLAGCEIVHYAIS